MGSQVHRRRPRPRTCVLARAWPAPIGRSCSHCSGMRAHARRSRTSSMPIAERNKFPWPLAMGQYLHGWLLTRRGELAGIKLMQDGRRAPAAAIRRPVLLTLVADELIRAGRHQDALDSGRTGRDQAEETTQFRMFHPEIYRLRGHALLHCPARNESEAEACFPAGNRARSRAILPRHRAARRHELRAACAAIRAGMSEARERAGADLSVVHGRVSIGRI